MIKSKTNFWDYVIIILSVAVVASLGTLFVNLGMEWFDTLIKPNNFVPSFVFGIVWSIIYLSFAVVLCVWISKNRLPKSTLILLILNGLFNILWCLLFFTLNNTLLGLVAIVINLILAYLLIVNIYKQNKVYAYLLFTYPVWISLATSLNLALWILN